MRLTVTTVPRRGMTQVRRTLTPVDRLIDWRTEQSNKAHNRPLS